MAIRVQTEDFDAGSELRRLRAGDRTIGAVASFVGLVRDLASAPVAEMVLEHYPGMTEKSLAAIVSEAQARWPLLGAAVIHRVGRLRAGEQIVWVGVASAHRKEAFAACEFIVDALKTRAPFWKKEYTPDGPRWVEARPADEQAARKWEGGDDESAQRS
ncbi:MAG: molybdenum cofactor biosynthesis protein MoaE [Betaproteobacteria bacterium]|nr:molybdenum cofactor biosynthesis protein MoaE [Betaproteobacteria bacterium]